MSLTIIDKYVSKKEHDLLEYAKILERIITIDNNSMWHDKKEFSNFAKDIIHIYASKYYFDNNTHRSNPIKYSNDNINFVSYAIIDYFKSNDLVAKLRDWKNETFLLSVLLCTACYVDFATNVVDGDYVDTKGKFKYLLTYLKKTNKLIINDNKNLIVKLFDQIKENMIVDRKFLESYKNDICYNKYQIVANNPRYYTFDFHYLLPEVDVNNKSIIAEVAKSYEAKLRTLSYNLLEYRILEDLISNMEMPIYLIKGDDILAKKSSLVKAFNNKYLKDYVRLYLSYEDSAKYINLINNFDAVGVKTVYEVNVDNTVDDTYFVNNIDAIVTMDFIKKNQDNMDKWNKDNIKLIVKNKEEN